MNIFKVIELNPHHFPGSDGPGSDGPPSRSAQVAEKAGLGVIYMGKDGIMISVPTRPPKPSSSMPEGLTALLRWARQAHAADWIWLDPLAPELTGVEPWSEL